MLYSRIIIGILLITILFPQAEKGKEQSQPVPKKFKDGFILAPTLSSELAVNLDQNNKFMNSTGIPDTMAYYPPYGFDGRNDLFPGEAMFTAFQMPADLTVKGINIPIYEWGSGNQQLTISIHKISYPYTTDDMIYPQSVVDENGWIGGYDMDDSTGFLSIVGATYTPGGTLSICDTAGVVVNGAQDPLGTNPAANSPGGTPTLGLIWPDSFTAATMDPINYPDSFNNWIDLEDYGSELDLMQGEWIGVLINFTGTGGGDYDGTGLFSAYGAGVVDPWVSCKFYKECNGPSGNGGWHIRSMIFDFELAAEFPTNPPVIYDINDLPTTLSTDSRTVSAHLIYTGGPDSGVVSAAIHYQIDSLTAPINNVEMELMSGESDSGIWEGEIPGQDPGTFVYWYLTATGPFGASSVSSPYSYLIFEPTPGNDLIYNNQDALYGTILYSSYLYFYWGGESFDIWDASYVGMGNELLDRYTTIIELGADHNNDAEIASWWDGDKTYIVSGDEWLGPRSGWSDGPTGDGSVAKSILGIAYQYNDINYTDSGDQEGISRLMSDSTGVTSVLYEFLSDSLLLNYDPDYETGNYNWLDGFEVVDGYTIDMTAYSGILDSNGNIPVDAEIYNVMVHGQAGNGGKSAFMSFDPIALNTTPGYHWIGASSYWNLSHPNCPPNASPLVSVYEALQDIVSVEDVREQPTTFSLKGNYPNPFNPATNIQFELHKDTHVEITIYDILGREVKKLVSGELVSGDHQVIWDGTNDLGISVSAGVYFYQLRADDYGQTKKMIFLK